MPIWSQPLSVAELNAMATETIHASLGIAFTEIGEDYLRATMPVDARTKQPFGLLHGGASVVLAESLGSMASWLVAGADRAAVGIEVNANHVKAARHGHVTGTVRAVHLIRTLHVWEIRVTNEQDQLVSIVRLTVLISSP